MFIFAGGMHGLQPKHVAPPIQPPDLSEDLDYFNIITGYALNALFSSQSFGGMAIDPDKQQTVKSLMEAKYPELSSVPETRLLSAKTVGYCIALGVHSLTFCQPKTFLKTQALNIYREYVEQKNWTMRSRRSGTRTCPGC